MEYHDEDIFRLLRYLAPPPSTNDNIEQSTVPSGTTAKKADLEQLSGDSVRADSVSVRQ